MIQLYVGLAILTVYLVVVILKDGKIPPSISDTFYTSGKWMFSIVIWLESILLQWSLLDVTPVNVQFVAFFVGAGLLFVGAAPHFKEAQEKVIHYTGAFTFAIASQVWYWIVPASMDYVMMGVMFGLVWLTAVACIMKWRENATFIAEIACIVVIVLGRSYLV